MSFLNWSFACGVLTGISTYALYKWMRENDLNQKDKIDSNDDCFLFLPESTKCKFKAKLCKHFSCSTCNFKRFLDLIKSAQHSLDICVYLITSDEITSAIRTVFSRGVFVRIIIDGDISQEAFSSKLFVFIKEHIPIKIVNSSRMMHNKFVIIDKKKLITGSFNWTTQGTASNYENAVIIHNKKILKKFDTYFTNIWNSRCDNVY